VRRFVALGDSFTEGVGDPFPLLPNGVRGWADRVAEQLAKAEPGWEYANLAVRSKRLRQIVADQLEPALELQPTLVSVYAGGNDLMDAGTDVAALLRDYESFISRLASSGATVLVFTGYDVPVFPALQLFRRRNRAYNEGVRAIARAHGALLVDYWALDGFDDARMWSPDRLHLSKRGHKRLAVEVLRVLGVTHSIRVKDKGAPAAPTLREWQRMRRRWLGDWVVPLVRRKLRGVTLGDDLGPRWPQPVVVPVRGGLRSLVRAR
jgi:lysophospholipase L1-like esterase